MRSARIELPIPSGRGSAMAPSVFGCDGASVFARDGAACPEGEEVGARLSRPARNVERRLTERRIAPPIFAIEIPERCPAPPSFGLAEEIRGLRVMEA